MHLILYCKGIHPVVPEGATNLTNALGFGDSEGKIGTGKVNITKGRLSEWVEGRISIF